MKTKIKQDRVLTAIVGSYPKPKYIWSKTGRELLDDLGASFDKREGSSFKAKLDKAALLAIRDQNLANIDFVTDGEERRRTYQIRPASRINCSASTSNRGA